MADFQFSIFLPASSNLPANDTRSGARQAGNFQKSPGAKKGRGGFTLVELIVSVGVFSIVMLVAVGALFSLLAANQRAQTLKVVMNNLNLAMENMVKDIRVGTHYHCDSVGDITQPRDCGLKSYFAFEASGGDTGTVSDQIVFRLNSSTIERSEDGGNSFVPIVSDDVVVENLNFYVYGAPTGDGAQPRVNILISGKAGIDEDTQTDFNIQATVTQRLIDS